MADDKGGSLNVISAGTYRELAQQIGAFFFVEAADIKEAVAAKHPDAHVGRFLGGGIEVCPCESFTSDNNPGCVER